MPDYRAATGVEYDESDDRNAVVAAGSEERVRQKRIEIVHHRRMQCKKSFHFPQTVAVTNSDSSVKDIEAMWLAIAKRISGGVADHFFPTILNRLSCAHFSSDNSRANSCLFPVWLAVLIFASGN
jgi:hypothetical protein